LVYAQTRLDPPQAQFASIAVEAIRAAHSPKADGPAAPTPCGERLSGLLRGLGAADTHW